MLNADDFIALIEKAETSGQIKAIVECVDICDFLEPGCEWVRLTEAISLRIDSCPDIRSERYCGCKVGVCANDHPNHRCTMRLQG